MLLLVVTPPGLDNENIEARQTADRYPYTAFLRVTRAAMCPCVTQCPPCFPLVHRQQEPTVWNNASLVLLYCNSATMQ